MVYNDWVDWRLQHGSYCQVCPLNGQRKVGTDGSADAGVILIGEAPGREEAEYNSAYQKYGKPFVGRSGWALKVKLLAPAGLAELEEKENGWPRVTKLKAFIMNTVMCRPPDNKINSVEGKKAVACCSPSAKALLDHLLTGQPNRTLVPLGGTALKLLTGEDAISLYRGRVMQLAADGLVAMPEADVLKIALRGVKPPTEAAPHLAVVKLMLSKQRSGLKSNPLKIEKARIGLLTSEVKSLAKPHLTLLSALLLRQRKSLTSGSS